MMKWFLFAVLVVLVEVSYSARIGHRRQSDVYEEVCEMKDVVSKVGCYKDNFLEANGTRPLTEQLVNIRDENSPVYVKSLHLDWHDWKGSLNGLICECAARAQAKGYTYIGVQFYGECWSGPNSGNYAEDGEASTCIQEYYTPCDVNNEEHPCAGAASTNYVYRLNSAYYRKK